MSDKPLFHVELPRGIHLAEAKLELFVECGERLDGLTVEILDEGGGAFLHLTTEGVSLDPEELDALTKTMLAVCDFIDGGKKQMPILHIFRGLPGSGKSTAARKLAEETGAILIEPDMLLVEDGEYQYTPSTFYGAYCRAGRIVETVSEFCADIIFADVLPRKEDVLEIRSCLSYRNQSIYRLIVHDLKITPEESKLRNRHNVKPEDIDRMAQTWEDWE